MSNAAVVALALVVLAAFAGAQTCFPTAPYAQRAALFEPESAGSCYDVVPTMAQLGKTVWFSPSVPCSQQVAPMEILTVGDIISSTQFAAVQAIAKTGAGPNEVSYAPADQKCHVGGFEYEPTLSVSSVCPHLSGKPNCFAAPNGVDLNAVAEAEMCALATSLAHRKIEVNSTCFKVFQKLLCSVFDPVMTGVATRSYPVEVPGHNLMVYQYSVCKTFRNSIVAAKCPAAMSEILPLRGYCNPAKPMQCTVPSLRPSLNEVKGMCVADQSDAYGDSVCLPACLGAPAGLMCACDKLTSPPPPPYVATSTTGSSDVTTTGATVGPAPARRHSSGPTGGAVVGIMSAIILVATAVYCAVGFAYNRVILGKRGMEQVPNHDFWAAVFGLCKPKSAAKENYFIGLDDSDFDGGGFDRHADVRPVFGGTGGVPRLPTRSIGGDDDDLDVDPLE